jgi:hypothetical protein
MGPLLLNLFKFCGLVLQDVYELCSKVIWFAHFMPIWVCQVLQGPWWIYIYIYRSINISFLFLSLYSYTLLSIDIIFIYIYICNVHAYESNFPQMEMNGL